MNRNTLIKITNRIAILTVLLLVYWVFIFISITVFDFKIFRENMTEAFYLSILGLFFILSGSMILNIMLNMTKISELIEKREQPVAEMKRSGKYTFWIYAASFPVIFFLLYGGD
ncbi:MAG: peptidase, partial [Spirochaetia bacterium]|nr:peptidase [Spirochaetia bacterium]